MCSCYLSFQGRCYLLQECETEKVRKRAGGGRGAEPHGGKVGCFAGDYGEDHLGLSQALEQTWSDTTATLDEYDNRLHYCHCRGLALAMYRSRGDGFSAMVH